MRILFIVHQFMPEFSSGTELFTINIAKMHQRNGHHVDVLTCSVGAASLWGGEINGLRHAVIDGVPVHGLPRVLLDKFAEIGLDTSEGARPVLSAFLERGTYDVVHVTHSMRMLSAVEIIRDYSIPYVVTLTDYFSVCYRVTLKRLDGNVCTGPDHGLACNTYCVSPLMRREVLAERRRRFASVLWNASNIVACSEFISMVFQNEFPDLPIRTQHHGVDLPRFRPVVENRDNTQIVFGFIGTLSEAKGVHVLTEAFARAAPAHARLELIGPSYDDEALLERLRAFRNPSVTIRDAIDHNDIPNALADFDVLCLPSLWPEPGTLALREGFAAGLPALVSDIGWPAEVVGKLGCGRTVPVGDVSAWCNAICEISENRAILKSWKEKVPLQLRIEEEAFFYDQLYRRAMFNSTP